MLFRSFALLGAFPIVTFAAAGRTPTSWDVSNTGEAAYSIPIFTPPGTNRMTPRLAFVYGHRSENTLLGVGWDIAGLSVIARCPRTWAQDGGPRNVRNDSSDKFCLDGNRLRLKNGTYGDHGAEYRTEMETFARAFSFDLTPGVTGPDYFTAETKDGLKYEYGNTADSRIQSTGQNVAREWAVNRISDRAGNAIVFTYEEDATNGGYHIQSINYTSNGLQGLLAQYTVTFVYELKWSFEIDIEYLAGSPIQEIKRLDRVDVSHAGTGLVRRYELTYEGTVSSTNRSRLASIQECGGTAGTDCLPATTFTYQNGTHGLGSQQSSGATVPSGVFPFGIDVNGDGRDDLVYSSSVTAGSGHWMVMLASTSGGYGSPINTGVVNHGYSGAIPIDYNSDGLQDLLVPYSGGTWWVMLGGSGGLSAPGNTSAPAPAGTTGTNAAAVDIDGDGLEDLVYAQVSGFSAPGDAIRYRRREWGATFAATPVDLVGPMASGWYIGPGLATTFGQQSKRRLPDLYGDRKSVV